MSKVINIKQRHVAERTCIACREKAAKGKLIRLVRTATGVVLVDIGGRLHGRGVYLCAFRDCWEAGLRGNRLEYTLRGKIDPESLERLSEYREILPERS